MGISYEFKTDDAFRFAHEMSARTKQVGSELSFAQCPYCLGGKHKDKYTFSINLKNGKNICQRASCGIKGNMITLARDFGFELTEDVARYYNIGARNDKFKSFRDAHKAIEVKDEAIDYLRSRGISEGVARRYEITLKNGSTSTLVFPFKMKW